MRFFVVGLVLIAVGISVTEYTRRHPSEKALAEVKGAKKVKSAPTAPPTMTALIDVASPPRDEAAPAFDVTALAASGAGFDGFTAVLKGSFKGRELKVAGSDAVLVVEKDGVSALVRVPKDGSANVLSARKATVAAVTFDPKEARVVWAEGGLIKSVPLGGGEVKTHIAFTRALVTSVAAHGSVMVATLVPRDGDPFGSDPNGAVVSIDDGEVKLIAVEQVRPREAQFDGKDDAFFVAGYPSGLTRAALDGSFTARIAERADGPVALEPDAITYRYPVTTSPELKRGSRAGGAVKSLARVDAEWLAVANGAARYTTTGIAPRLYEAKPDQEPTELAALKGSVKGLAWSGAVLWLLTSDDEGVTTLQVQ